MKKRFPAVLLLVIPLAFAAPSFAQSSSFGFLLGGAESLEDGIDLNLGDGVSEVFIGTELEMQTIFRIKLGQVDFDSGPRQGEIQYVQLLIDYEFHEVFGSTSIFVGPAWYKHDAGGDVNEEDDFGLSGGLAADFPFSRRISFIAELTYHWVNFDEPYRFLTATGGLKLRF